MKVIQSLNGFRTILAAFIVIHHVFYFFFPVANEKIRQYISLDTPVSFFFVLSGFVLYYVYSNTFDIKKFYKKRFVKLVIPYWISILLLFIFIGHSRFGFANPDGITIATTILGLNAFVPNFKYIFALNPVGWYMSALFFMVFMFPLIQKFVNRKYGYLYIAISYIIGYFLLCLWGVSVVGLDSQLDSTAKGVDISCFLKFNPFARFFQFIFGMYVCKLIMHFDFSKIKKFGSILFLIGFLFLFYFPIRSYACAHVCAHSAHTTIDLIYHYIFIFIYDMLFSSVVIFSLFPDCSIISNIFKTKPMLFLGNQSYLIFIFHTMLLQYMMIKLMFQIPKWQAFILYISCLIAFCYLISLILKLNYSAIWLSTKKYIINIKEFISQKWYGGGGNKSLWQIGVFRLRCSQYVNL